MTWREENADILESGFYYHLLSKGSIKPENQEPDVAPYAYYISAFSELGTTRQVGMGLGPIPFTAIVEYYTLFPCDDDVEDFLYVIRKMDSAFMKVQNKKGSLKNGNASSNSRDHSKNGRKGSSRA